MGAPASGKSSYAASLLAQSTSSTSLPTIHLLSLDTLYDTAISPTSSLSFSPTAWHDSRILALTTASQLLTSLTSSPASPTPAPCPAHVLLIDDVFHLRSMRLPYLRLCRLHRVAYAQLFLDEALPTCLARHSSRLSPASRPSPSHVPLTPGLISTLHSAFERPTPAEAKYTLAFTAASIPTFPELLSALAGVAAVPAPAALPPQPQVQSDVHVMDLCMRRLIGQHMRLHPRSDAKALNAIRKRLLEEARDPAHALHLLDDASNPVIPLPAADVDEATARRVQGLVQYFAALLTQCVDTGG